MDGRDRNRSRRLHAVHELVIRGLKRLNGCTKERQVTHPPVYRLCSFLMRRAFLFCISFCIVISCIFSSAVQFLDSHQRFSTPAWI